MNIKVKEILKDVFSLDNDTADHEEIKNRLEDGGQITGTNMCFSCTTLEADDSEDYEIY